MSLQSALIAIGVILIIAIYIVSAMLEKKKSNSRKAKSGQFGLNDKDEPSLMNLDSSDEAVDEIPILDSPLVKNTFESDHDDPFRDPELQEHLPERAEQMRNTEGPERQAENKQEPGNQQQESFESEFAYSLDESDLDQEKLEEDSPESSDHGLKQDALSESDGDLPEGHTLALSEDMVLPEITANADEKSSIGIPDEPEDFESEIDSLLDDFQEDTLEQDHLLQEPTISAGHVEEVGDEAQITNQIDQEEMPDKRLGTLTGPVAEDSIEIPGKNYVASPSTSDMNETDFHDMTDSEQRLDSDDIDDEDQTGNIPVLEVVDQVQEDDTPAETPADTKVGSPIDKISDQGVRQVNQYETIVKSRDQAIGEANESDGNINVGDSDKNLEKKLNVKIEPRLSQFDEPVAEPSAQFSEPERTSGEYVYPDIPGFEKITQIDYWVKIHGERDVGRESVLAQYREAKSSLTKISRIHGIKFPEKSWCDLEQESEDARFGDLIVTIQLADQKGSIDKAELTQFSNLVSKLSGGTGRGFTFMAPIESALQQASAISDFVRFYDSIFVINIKPVQTEYFDGTLINRCATQLGLERSENNYFVRNKIMGKRKVCLYSLANMSDTGTFDFDNIKDLRTRGVTFFTKPAANRSPGAVFSEMVDTAKAFAGRVKGEAIAPNHDDLSQEDVDQIRLDIEKVADDMEEQGMTPGSDEAMRIF